MLQPVTEQYGIIIVNGFSFLTQEKRGWIRYPFFWGGVFLSSSALAKRHSILGYPLPDDRWDAASGLGSLVVGGVGVAASRKAIMYASISMLRGKFV